MQLFSRLHRRVQLTGPGRELQEAVTIGLGHIARVAEDVRGFGETGDITISCSVTFASYWLMSRIAKFRAEFSDVDIRMVASASVRDLAATGIDLAVRYGRGTWPNVTAKHLFGDTIIPVAAPQYVEAHGPFDTQASLENATYLHLSKFDRNWVTWEHWFEKYGATMPRSAHHLYFDNYTVLMHAAVRGEGLALCGGASLKTSYCAVNCCKPRRTLWTQNILFTSCIPIHSRCGHMRNRFVTGCSMRRMVPSECSLAAANFFALSLNGALHR